jgi:cellulose synthase/poly-beta-1,6-N-acetylglucosamine synthase-like glycosyltransferase
MVSLVMLIVCVVSLCWILNQRRYPPSKRYGMIDAIVPAYNEEMCIIDTVRCLIANPYINKVIVVNDGSTDKTATLLDLLAVGYQRLKVVHQKNTGKGGALMNGLSHSDAPYVYLSDADTLVPSNDDGLGYMIAEIERGADAVGGVALSNLDGAGLLPHIRASTKLACVLILRTFQQLVGGHPFLISGACGLFKRQVLMDVPFSDRTKVEDLDMSWSLIAKGYKIRQASRAFVYSQEANSLKGEWLRWRRWIVGYAVCMRLHSNLLLTRFGLGTMIPVFLTSFLASGLVAYTISTVSLSAVVHAHHLSLYTWIWLGMMFAIGLASAIHHRKASLLLLLPASVVYVLMSSSVWLIHGLRGLFTGHEPQRDKPQRYVVA